MQITKLPHSNIFIETKDAKILIDPGTYGSDEKTKKIWAKATHVFVTHKHADHFDAETISKIIQKGTPIYATRETATFYPKTKFSIIKEGAEIKIGGTVVRAVKAVHGYNPFLKGEKEVHEGIGFFVESEGKRVYHTGDTICFENDYKCDVLFLPANNHGVCMGPFEAALFAKETGASIVVVMHCESEKFPTDVEKVKKEFDNAKLNWKFLSAGETIEV